MTDMRKLINLLNENEVLDEMPIQHFQTVGDFNKNSSFRHPEDRKILTNPKAVAKIHKKFANNHYDFNFFFVNSPEGNRHTEIGLVNPQWMETNMPKAWTEIAPNINRDAINVIFTNNKGDERYPMTAWIIAHRLGHVFYANRTDFRRYNLWTEAETAVETFTKEMLTYFGIAAPNGRSRYGGFTAGFDNRNYLKMAQHLYQAVGTMKSARDGNLRNAHEFLHEMLAQFLTTGKVTLQPASAIITGYAWGKAQQRYASTDSQEDISQIVQTFENDINYYLTTILDSATGGIFVM